MINHRQITSLTELALKAFLRARKELNFEMTPLHDVVIKHEILKLIPDLLKAIANANPEEVKDILEFCPKLAVIGCGTVATVSGYTYENVTPIQLLYLMDDDEMFNDVILPCIQKLPAEMIERARKQLADKMMEVEKQRTQFKPYDFKEIFKAITIDKILRETGEPSEATKIALTKFKTDFIPNVITHGKPWIKEHLQKGFLEYSNGVDRRCAGWRGWNPTQNKWYLVNIIGHLQTLVEKCFEQECSQGFYKNHHPNQRSVRITNEIYGYKNIPLSYRSNVDSSLILGRDYFVDILQGVAGYDYSSTWEETWHYLDRHLDDKNMRWKELSSNLAANIHKPELSTVAKIF